MLVEVDAGSHKFTYLDKPKQYRVYHKPNGPAKAWIDGHWTWWLNGRAHRYYGPSSNNGIWFIHGDRLTRYIVDD